MLLIAKVLAIYSQGGGKAGAHAWQPQVKSIGAVSYLATQVYEHAFHLQFRAVHQRAAALQAFTFAHLPSDKFLYRIPGPMTITSDRRLLDVDQSTFSTFMELQKQLPRLQAALKALSKARKVGKDIREH
ncbi:hypothetical protein BJ138DRAFT_1057256 [Hygrophoropsis aurantiaca]|uniref:Uncharacterized protein n=1 Tax=Hygrophoropsis aurantiaca TaxID=72124 RepID=A0ACB8ALV8_9AGAM|nr:hypothetical protein BJ138DRAFT_1057256 [Hygrophoropsis aurantiaca]